MSSVQKDVALRAGIQATAPAVDSSALARMCIRIVYVRMHAYIQSLSHELPLGVQQHILALAGNTCARRVSKACRDAFDAANDT